jgi:hypothetical protein
LISVKLPLGAVTIGGQAFAGCSNLSYVTIPSTVTSISIAAFYDCTSLESIVLPDSLKSLRNAAFMGCHKLTSINIPSLIVSLLSETFSGCTKLKLTLPSKISLIANGAFSGCDSIFVDAGSTKFVSVNGSLFSKDTTVFYHSPNSFTGVYTVPSTVKTINNEAFYNCSAVTSVSIPASVTSVTNDAFYDNFSAPVVVDTANATYSSVDGVLFNKAKTTLIYFPSIKSGTYIIPYTVTTLADAAFWNCKKLTTVTIPYSVTSIGGLNFWNYTGLKSIKLGSFTPVTLTTTYTYFDSVPKDICTIYVPYGAKAAYQAATIWKDFTHIIEGDGFWMSKSTCTFDALPTKTDSVAVYSNTGWSVTPSASWINVNQTFGFANDTLIITAAQNTSTTARTGTVTVSIPGVSTQTITVTQEAGTMDALVENEALSIHIYPNPATDYIQIQGLPGNAEISIYDLSGNQISSQRSDGTLNISSLTKGVYLVRIVTQNTTVQQKLIKQ